jgi:uncharacterized integral membrane protein
MANHSRREEEVPPLKSEHEGGPVEAEVEPAGSSVAIVSTRTSRAWIKLLPFLVVLAVILTFVFQNPKNVKVTLFTFSGTLPLSVALLGAVILGTLLAMALGSMRIFQLRRLVRQKSVSEKSTRNSK